ncbi:MAG TPA: nucleotidyltransferase family protein [bacterium]|nr:nucleotidyltransferase family protein [bacterium]
MKAILLAGGKGRRLLPYSTILPKPLMPIGDMPILEIIIRQLKYYGITDIIISVGHLANIIQAFFGNGEKWGVNIEYSIEDEPLGTAAPLKLIDGLDEDFLLMNGDVFTTLNYNNLVRYHKNRNSLFTVATFERTVKMSFGIIEIDCYGITNYREKPVYNFDVSMGVYCINPEVLKFITKNKYLDINDLIMELIEDGHSVNSYKEDCSWLDIGRVDDYEAAVKIFEKEREKYLYE